jgi:hypothetical protein
LEWNPYIIEVILHAATEVTIFYEEARWFFSNPALRFVVWLIYLYKRSWTTS